MNIVNVWFETFRDSFSFCTTKEINMFCHVFFFQRGYICYEMKCITRVSSKFIQQLIVSKYGPSTIFSARTIREILPRFYHVFADTCNYRILFYSVSDYINQRKIVNQ